jgi:hypothetical protein
MRSAGMSQFGAQAISKVFMDRKVKFASSESTASPFLVTTHLRVLHRYCPPCQAGQESQVPFYFLEKMEAEFGRKGPLESIYLLDALQKTCKTDAELTMVVPPCDHLACMAMTW